MKCEKANRYLVAAIEEFYSKNNQTNKMLE